MSEQKRTAQNNDEPKYYQSVPMPLEFDEVTKDQRDGGYDDWVKDLCLDDLTPEEFAALGRSLGADTGDKPATAAPNKTFQSNPDLRPGTENLGHVEGLTEDGSYFEAELWVWNEELCVSFLLNEKWEFAPESEFMAEVAEKRAVEAGELTYAHMESDRSELIQGMVIRDDSLSQEETMRYVEYLTQMGLIEFQTEVCNGFVDALTDIEGNSVVQCIITLESARFGAEAVTPLQFRPFEGPTRLDNSDFKVVACGTNDEQPAQDGSEPDHSCYDIADLYDQAYECTIAHRQEIKNSHLCSCLYCGKTFPPSYIYRWVDNDQTAVCPYCGVDMVFSHDSVDFPVDEFFTKALGAYRDSQTM